MSRLIFRAHSPVEMVITDPEGRRLGFDPRTQTSYTEIPAAFYGEDGTIAAGDGQILIPGEKAAALNAPIDGEYIIQAIGTDTGSYYVDGEAYDRNGGLTRIEGPSGMTSPNQVDTAAISYSSQPAAVGGMAEYPQLEPEAASTTRPSSTPSALAIAALASGTALLLLAGAWYARRLWHKW